MVVVIGLSLRPSFSWRVPGCLVVDTEGIGNQDKRPGTMQMNRTCTFQSLILF
jgi:hypothetical protein